MAFYVLDDNNNKIEALDKEGVLNAIEEAIRNGSLANLVADAGFITKLKCCVSGSTNKMGFITQAKYNELEAADLVEKNTAYLIYDDPTLENIENELVKIDQSLKYLNEYTAGVLAVPKAVNAENAQQANYANSADWANDAGYSETAGEATNAKYTKYFNGEEMKISSNNNGSIVNITKTGLYVCTIKQLMEFSGDIFYCYLTALISVPNLNYNCSTNIATSSNAENSTNRLVIYYDAAVKYLRLMDNITSDTFTFEKCRLITEY